MKTIQKTTLATILSIALGSGAFAQDQKKFSIYLNMEKNGEQVTIDTSFASREDMENYLQSQGFDTPEAIELPELPELSDLPQMEEIIINIDDMELSTEKKAEMEAAMEAAKKEMKKAAKEMEIHEGEMEKHKEEMEKARKEMKMMKIEIDENENGSPKKVIIRSSGDGEVQTWTTDDEVFIHLDEKADKYNYKYKIIRLNDGEDSGEEKKVKVIRQIERSDDKDKVIEESKPAIKSDDADQIENTPEQKKDSEASYKLAASDFKIYPNPTQGKITVSFKTEKDGPVSVKLLDASGRVVIDEEVQVQNGNFSSEYNIEGKARGTYLLQLKQGDQWRHEKIVMK